MRNISYSSLPLIIVFVELSPIMLRFLFMVIFFEMAYVPSYKKIFVFVFELSMNKL